jgi:hypothetical protein
VTGLGRNGTASIPIGSNVPDSWNPGGDIVEDIVVEDDRVYIAGYFSSLGGQARQHVGRVSSATGLADAWNPGPAQAVLTVQPVDGKVLFGGSFDYLGGTARTYIAAFNSTTGALDPWTASSSPGQVHALAVSGSWVYGGMSLGSLRRWDVTTGTMDATFTPNANANIESITVTATRVYFGGDFTSVNGTARNRMAAVDLSGNLDMTFNPNADNTVQTMTSTGTWLVVGGRFLNVGGLARNHIARLSLVTGVADAAWNPNANSDVGGLALNGTTLFTSGSFANIGGGARAGIAALDTAAGTAIAPTFSLAPSNAGKVAYASGSLFVQDMISFHQFDAVTGSATPWSPSSWGGYAIAANATHVFAAGDMYGVNNMPQAGWALWQMPPLPTLTLTVDNATAGIGTVSPGANATATTVVTVTTDNPTGYTLRASDTSDSWGIVGGSNVPDWTGTGATPTTWTAGTSGYFGITVLGATGGAVSRLAKWGTGTNTTATDYVNNKYAGLKATSDVDLHVRNGTYLPSDTVTTAYRFSPAGAHFVGAYSMSVTYTAIANP